MDQPANSPNPDLASALEAQGLRILSPLEAAASPTVYRLRDVNGDRLQVLKLLPDDLKRHASYAYDFKQAVLKVSKVEVPGLVHVFRIVEGPSYLGALLEYVDGEDLGHILGREGRLAPNRAVRICHGVALSLLRACASGLHHGDLRPTSVLVASGGAVRLLGVGLPHPMPIVPTGASANDVPYGIPLERLFIPPPSPIRADIYRLGFLLYHMLVGVPPMAAASPHESLTQLRRSAWPSVRRVLPDAPPLLERVLGRLCDRVEGYLGFDDLLMDLDRLRVDLPEKATAAPVVEDRVTQAMAAVAPEAPSAPAAVKAPRPSRLRLPAAFVASALLGIGLVGPVFRLRTAPPTPPPATPLVPAATEVPGGVPDATDPASQGEQAFRRAVRLYEADPSDTAEAVRRFREVISKYPETKWAAEAEVRVGEVFRRSEEDLDRAYERMQKQVDVLVEWENFSEALAQIDAFLADRPESRYTPDALERRRSVDQTGRDWARVAFGKGKALMSEGKWDEARILLTRVSQMALTEPARNDAAAEVKSCDEALKDADAKRHEKERVAKQEVLEDELARVAGQVRSAFAAYDFEGASEKARTLREAIDDAEFPSVAKKAGWLARAASGAARAREAAVAGINGGTKAMPPGVYGPGHMMAQIVSATSERVTLKLQEAEATTAIGWKDLGAREALDVFERFAADGDADEALGLGAAAACAGIPEWAEKRFAKAGEAEAVEYLKKALGHR